MSKAILASFVASLCVLVHSAEARQYTRCGLVQELIFQEFTDLENWVCLIEAGSGRNTGAIHSDGGKAKYGLFQIDTDWCSEGMYPMKKCFTLCRFLITDDITKSAKCAKKIYTQGGLKNFPAWRENCEGKPLPDISHCLN